MVSILGAILTEKYAKKEFIAGCATGVIANFMAWKGSVPKNPLIVSGLLAGTLASNTSWVMSWLTNSNPKTASGVGVVIGSCVYSMIYNQLH